MKTIVTSVAVVLVAVLGWAGSLGAQAAVTEADIKRLETSANDIGHTAGMLAKTDPTAADLVEKQLVALKEEITYLRVKLRREGVTRAEYAEVRDRLETLRIRSLGQKVSADPVMSDDPMPGTRGWTVPVGTEMDVRLQTALNSATAKVEQRFEATTLVDLKIDGAVAIPAGTEVRGFVGSVRPAGRVNRKGAMTLAFDEIVVRSPMRLRATVTQALDGKMSEDASRVGTGAVIGAVLGGLLGGGKGMLLGVLVGGGGVAASTDGSDVDLPIGTILRLRIDAPLEIR
jgi:hypothetical protein